MVWVTIWMVMSGSTWWFIFRRWYIIERPLYLAMGTNHPSVYKETSKWLKLKELSVRREDPLSCCEHFFQLASSFELNYVRSTVISKQFNEDPFETLSGTIGIKETTKRRLAFGPGRWSTTREDNVGTSLERQGMRKRRDPAGHCAKLAVELCWLLKKS